MKKYSMEKILKILSEKKQTDKRYERICRELNITE